jgi:hypothetical protein
MSPHERKDIRVESKGTATSHRGKLLSAEPNKRRYGQAVGVSLFLRGGKFKCGTFKLGQFPTGHGAPVVVHNKTAQRNALSQLLNWDYNF